MPTVTGGEPPFDERIETQVVAANGVEFSLLVAGPPDGELALCLHGFPDSAWTWRFLLPALAGAGYRAVAPFQRGYAPTQIPPDGHYQSGALVADACALHEVLTSSTTPGEERPGVIIGHDWGAMAAYGAAAFEPDRWRRVVTASVPPSGALAAGFFNYDQLRRSWYIFFFQTPLAEGAMMMDDLAFIDRLWGDWSPGYDASVDVALVKDSLRGPGNLEAAVRYYRAMFDPALQVPELSNQQMATVAPTPQPTLYIHGRNDGCLGIDVASSAVDFLSEGSQMHIVDGAGHFMNVEKPDEVNAKILDFLEP